MKPKKSSKKSPSKRKAPKKAKLVQASGGPSRKAAIPQPNLKQPPKASTSSNNGAGRPLTSEAELKLRVAMGQGLRELREAHGDALAPFAVSLGIAVSRWRAIESGVAALPAYLVRSVANRLGLPVERVYDLVDGRLPLYAAKSRARSDERQAEIAWPLGQVSNA